MYGHRQTGMDKDRQVWTWTKTCMDTYKDMYGPRQTCSIYYYIITLNRFWTVIQASNSVDQCKTIQYDIRIGVSEYIYYRLTYSLGVNTFLLGTILCGRYMEWFTMSPA